MISLPVLPEVSNNFVILKGTLCISLIFKSTKSLIVTKFSKYPVISKSVRDRKTGFTTSIVKVHDANKNIQVVPNSVTILEILIV